MFGVFFHFVTLNHPSFGNVLNMHLYEGHNERMVKLNIKHPYISHRHMWYICMQTHLSKPEQARI